jgi:hypothetical protein
MRLFLGTAVLAAGVTLAVPAAAQHAFASADAAEAAIGDEQSWGTASDSVFTAWAGDFHHFGFPGTEGPLNLGTGARTCSSGQCGWTAGLHVPSGAQILGVEVSACDGDPTQEVKFWLLQGPKVPGPAIILPPAGGTGVAATPGCATFSLTLAAPHTVQNNASGYALVVNATPGTNIEWNQFRVRYRLQVSPAPATATFPSDVPTTHPFFRFVEALAAAGITGGCGPGAYCPDGAVTRGQMAVFLATALGLHFSN